MRARRLEEFEKPFWNSMSISLLIDAKFVLEINDGQIVGLETCKDKEYKTHVNVRF